MTACLRSTLLCLTALVVAAVSALAALPGAGGVLGPNEAYPTASHAWAVLPLTSGRGFALVHLPPRVASDGKAGSPGGSVRSGYRLDETPEAMAAYADRLYLVFRPKPKADTEHSTQRSVFSQSVRRFAQSELWVDEPSGRLETLPAIPDAGDLLALAADGRGPIALFENAGTPKLYLLDGSNWLTLELPAELSRALRGRSGMPSLAVEGEDLRFVCRRGAELIEASVALDALRGPSPTWSIERKEIPALSQAKSDQPLLRAAGRWVLVEDIDSPKVTLRSINGNTLSDLAAVAVPGPVRSITVQQGSARWIVISSPERRNAANTPTPFAQDSPTHVTEVSLITGQVMFDGPLRGASPLGTNEFRFLAVVLMLAMAMVLVLVLRGQQETVHLPEGFALAEPLRRIVAGVMDIGLAALLLPRVTSLVLPAGAGGDLFDLFDPQAWISGNAIRLLVALAAIGTVIGTLGEWIFGRSPGKLLTDCEVVSISSAAASTQPGETEEIHRPSFAACFIRNCIKWFLSPVALLAIMDDSGRHRGDQIARAAVVVEIVEDDELDDGE
ncbi:MAG: RDD family protein [Phycisphaerales bacterium]|nr:RDD family protein [Phycisphaerales bacterium]